jgi:hypothetical protein
LFGRDTLVVVTNLDHEPAFAGIPNTRTLHHGALAGDDGFDVDLLVSLGGPFAPPEGLHLPPPGG